MPLVGFLVSVLAAGAMLWSFYSGVLAVQIRDFDDFWHLWSGRLIVESGTVPRVDPVCFSSTGLDWINVNWLAQVLNYRAFLAYGLAGPAELAALAAAVVLACHLYLLRRIEAGAIPSVLSLAVLLYRLEASFSTRPQIYSFALLAVVSLILRLNTDRSRISFSAAAAIAAIMLVWNNLHGGVIFGYALLACDATGSVLERRCAASGWINTGNNTGGKNLLTQRSLAVSAVAVIGLGGFAFHPHGFAALQHILFYGSSMQTAFYQRIAELQPIDAASTAGMVFALYVAAGAIVISKTKRLSPLRETIFFVVFVCLTQTMRRFFTPLVIVTLPYVVSGITAIAAGLPEKVRRRYGKFERLFMPSPKLFAAGLAAMLLIFAVFALPGRTMQRRPGEPDTGLIRSDMFPVKIAAYLATEGADGRIFNDYNLGGYLGWVLYPQNRIFIDGRGDLHSLGKAYDQYISVVELAPGWEEILHSLNAKYVVAPQISPLSVKLKQDQHWQVRLAEYPYLLLEKVDLTATS